MPRDLFERSAESVDAIIGTPVTAAACAVATSPCPSVAHNPITPIGLMKIGVGRCMPNSSTERSRCAAPTNMRGTMP